MIFVPLSDDDLRTLLADRRLTDRPAFTASPSLCREHGFGPQEQEEADYQAFWLAAVEAIRLTDDGVDAGDPRRAGRIVVAADLEDRRVTARSDDPYGRAQADVVEMRDLTAVYLDEPEARAALTRARTIVGDSDLALLVAAPEVVSLLKDHELLWYLPAEMAD